MGLVTVELHANVREKNQAGMSSPQSLLHSSAHGARLYIRNISVFKLLLMINVLQMQP